MNRDTIVRYLRAKAKAIEYINDPNNRDELTMMISEITGERPEIVDRIVASYADPNLHILTRRGELDPDGFDNLLQFAKDAGYWEGAFPPADQFIDLSYGQEAGIQ